MKGPGSKGLGRFRLRAHPGARALRNRKHLHIRQIVQIDMGPLCIGCTLFTGAAESQALRGGSHFAVEGYSEAIACEEKVLRERPKVSPSLRIFAARHSSLGHMNQARGEIAPSALSVAGQLDQAGRLRSTSLYALASDRAVGGRFAQREIARGMTVSES